MALVEAEEAPGFIALGKDRDGAIGKAELGLALLVSLGFIAWAGLSLSTPVEPRPAHA